MLFKNKRDRKVLPHAALPPQPPACTPRRARWGVAREPPLQPSYPSVDALASGASGAGRWRSSCLRGVGQRARSLCADGRARRRGR